MSSMQFGDVLARRAPHRDAPELPRSAARAAQTPTNSLWHRLATSTGSLQAALAVSAPGDAYEQEADRVAEQAVRTPDAGSVGSAHVQRLSNGGSVPAISPDTESRIAAMRSHGGRRLGDNVRASMEPRFGFDFSQVRVHADQQSAATAQSLHARAFTVGRDIMFGAGEFTPGTTSGLRLLAHELTHVVQQADGGTGESAGGAAPQIQRDSLEIVGDDASSVKSNQRKAAKSCPIYCNDDPTGTLHAMPLFHQIYKDKDQGTIVNRGGQDYDAATGIGVALHFMKRPEGTGRGADSPRCSCDEFKFIQVLDESHDQSGKPTVEVDVNRTERGESGKTPTPYYGDWARNREHADKHEIPPPYPDGGEKVDADVSMFDRPARDPATDLKDHRDFSWKAETRVVCLGDRHRPMILGGVGYGFSRKFDASRKSYLPIQDFSPECLPETPSAKFTEALRKDKSFPQL